MVSSYWGGSDELQVLPEKRDSDRRGHGRVSLVRDRQPRQHTFLEAFRAAYGKPPLTAAYFEFMTLQALRLAIDKAKSIDTDEVIKALAGLQFDSVVGP